MPRLNPTGASGECAEEAIVPSDTHMRLWSACLWDANQLMIIRDPPVGTIRRADTSFRTVLAWIDEVSDGAAHPDPRPRRSSARQRR